jgi:hypothetical protein
VTNNGDQPGSLSAVDEWCDGEWNWRCRCWFDAVAVAVAVAVAAVAVTAAAAAGSFLSANSLWRGGL